MNEKLHINILLIEDNPTDVLLLRGALTEVTGFAFSLTQVDRLAAGMTRLRQETFDVVLLDLGLPDSNGVDTFVQLHEHHPGVPVLVVTGLTEKAGAIKAMQEEGQDYLIKNQLQTPLLERSIRYAIERHHTVAALREGQERFRRCFELGLVGMAITSPNKGFIEVNDKLCEILGYERSELMQLSWGKLTHPDDLMADLVNFNQVMAGEYDSYSMDKRFIHKDGQIIDAIISANCLRRADGSVDYFVVLLQDITERKRAERDLRESKELNQAILDSLTANIAVLGSDGKIIAVNEAWTRFARDNNGGATDLASVSVGANYFDVFDVSCHNVGNAEALADGEIVKEGLQAVLEGTRKNFSHEYACHYPTENCWFMLHVSPLWHERGGAVVAHVDITGRKQAERRLATQNAVGRVLAEANSLSEATPKIIQALCESEEWEFGAVWEVDKQANVLRCVDVWHTPGIQVEALKARTHEITFAPGIGLPGYVWISGEPVLISRVTPESNFLRADLATQAGMHSTLGFPILLGSDVIGVVDFWGRAIHEPNQRLLDTLRAIGSQIGQFIERKRVQEEAQRFVSLSPAVIYALKVDGESFRQTWISENVINLTGYGSDEPIGIDWWFQHVHPDEREHIRAAHPIPYEIDHQVLEYRFQRKDESYFWVRDEKRLLRDAQGNSAEIIGAWSDITEWVKLEAQFRQAQKMEGIGLLAGGVAHDFNNLLTVIMGYCDILLTHVPSDHSQKSFVTIIRQAGERAASLTRQLLAFSRKQIFELKVLDLNDVVSSVEKMLRRLIGEDILLPTILSPFLNRVKIDPSQIEQVILNLAVNARDAMPQGGQLTIETSNIELDEEYCRLHPESQPGRYVQLSVCDTGCGMTPEVKARIFEPFFTTKGVGQGTGLGLATVFGIVKQSEGYIEVHSEVGIGTCFKIYFPAVDAKEVSLQTDRVDEPVRHGSETVLLVEDEESVRQIAKLILETHGYKVLVASDGPQGILMSETYYGPVNLLVTDVVMPEMSGRQLAEILQARRVGLKVLFMSGYIDDAIIRHGIIEANEAFLHKPFSPLTLARKVRDVLDAHP